MDFMSPCLRHQESAVLYFFRCMYLFSKDNKIRILLFCDFLKQLGYCKRLKSFIFLVIEQHMNATISTHGKGCTKGFLQNECDHTKSQVVA